MFLSFAFFLLFADPIEHIRHYSDDTLELKNLKQLVSSSDGRYFFALDENHVNLLRWDLYENRFAVTAAFDSRDLKNIDSLSDLVVSPDGNRVFVLSGPQGRLGVFDIADQGQRLSWKQTLAVDHQGNPFQQTDVMAITPDGTLYLAGDDTHGLVVCGEKGSGDLEVLSTQSLTMRPTSMWVSPNDHFLYLANDQKAAWFDITHAEAPTFVGEMAFQHPVLGVHLGDNRFWAYRADQVDVYSQNPSSGALSHQHSFSGEQAQWRSLVSAGDGSVYLANESTLEVEEWVFTNQDWQRERTMAQQEAPRFLTVCPKTHILMSSDGSTSLEGVNLSQWQNVSRWHQGQIVGGPLVGSLDMAYDEVNKRWFVVDAQPSLVYVYEEREGASMKWVATHEIPNQGGSTDNKKLSFHQETLFLLENGLSQLSFSDSGQMTFVRYTSPDEIPELGSATDMIGQDYGMPQAIVLNSELGSLVTVQDGKVENRLSGRDMLYRAHKLQRVLDLSAYYVLAPDELLYFGGFYDVRSLVPSEIGMDEFIDLSTGGFLLNTLLAKKGNTYYISRIWENIADYRQEMDDVKSVQELVVRDEQSYVLGEGDQGQTIFRYQRDLSTYIMERVEGLSGTTANGEHLYIGEDFLYTAGAEGADAFSVPTEKILQGSIPWVVANEAFLTRMVVHNPLGRKQTVTLVAVDRAGNKATHDESIEANSTFAADADTLFDGLSGYAVYVYAANPVMPSFLTFNQEEVSGGHSPSQTIASQTTSNEVTFGYVPGSEVAAVVLVAPESTGQLEVTLHLDGPEQQDLAQATVQLNEDRPLAALVGDLFTVEVPEHASVRATCDRGEITGTTFIFNDLSQPSMTAAFTEFQQPNPLGPTGVFPWVVNNAAFRSRLVWLNGHTAPVELTLRAVDLQGTTHTAELTLPLGTTAREAGALFGDLSGYTLYYEQHGSAPIFGSYLTFNIEPISGGNSPSQTAAPFGKECGSEIVFGYMPGEEVAAMVIVNPEASATQVDLYLMGNIGMVLDHAVVEVPAGAPLPLLAGLVFESPVPADATVRAISRNGACLMGTTFTFNQLSQPSMARVFIP